MTLLSRQLIDLNALRRYFDLDKQHWAKTLYQQGQAKVIEFTGKSAVCEVYEKKQTFQVIIRADQNQVMFQCSCQATEPHPRFCHHVLAATYILRDYLKNVAEKDWRYRLELTLASVPVPTKKVLKSQETLPAGILLVGLETEKGSQSSFYSATLRPYFISAKQWESIREIEANPSPQEAALELLASRDDWAQFIQPYLREAPVRLVNLSFEGRELIDMALSGSYRYNEYHGLNSYYSSYYLPSISFGRLRLIEHMNIPIFLKQEKEYPSLLRVAPEAVPLQALLIEGEKFYELQVGIELQGQTYTLRGRRLQIFAQTSPLWALAGKTLVQIENLYFMGQTRKKEPAHFEGYDIVLTTYGTMLRDIEFLRAYRFSYAILDESQAIKNPLAQSSKAARLLQADHRLCLTGTPVENNVYELWSQFAFLNPGLLGSLDSFKNEFAVAIERRNEASQTTAQTLRRLIYPFILRRTKEQVAPELPPRTERIIYTDLEPAQRKLYEQTRDEYRSLLLGLLRESQDISDIRFKILEGLLRLRQVCIHPCLVDPTYRGKSAKFEILLETLETLQAEGHKALIFSQFVQTLSLLRKEMEARSMSYVYLDGQTQNRQEQVDRFQNDPNVPFFLISLKAGGVGLNLTAADYVLHLDPWWNPAVEMQAADRAHRIGQDKPVFIYKFIARETVEEKIMQLQERKRELVEQLISAESGIFKSLTKEDVQVLFS